MSKVCPTCGTPTGVSPVRVTSTTNEIDHVAGGTDEYMESWQRYHCEHCDEMFAVQVEEVHLRHHE